MCFRYLWDPVYITFIFSWTVLTIKIFFKQWYFSMKFCLLVTVALDIFIKEKNKTSYLPCIFPLSFFYAKGVYLVTLSGVVSHQSSLLVIFYTNFQAPSLLEPPPFRVSLLFSPEVWGRVVRWFLKVVQGIRVNILC